MDAVAELHAAIFGIQGVYLVVAPSSSKAGNTNPRISIYSHFYFCFCFFHGFFASYMNG